MKDRNEDRTSEATCGRCEGCGKIANTAEGEPWTAWTSLPLHSSHAVLLGLVKPVPCPDCGGTGRKRDRHLNQEAEARAVECDYLDDDPEVRQPARRYQAEVVRQIPDPSRGIREEFATVEALLPGDRVRVRYSDGTLSDAPASAFEAVGPRADRTCPGSGRGAHPFAEPGDEDRCLVCHRRCLVMADRTVSIHDRPDHEDRCPCCGELVEDHGPSEVTP